MLPPYEPELLRLLPPYELLPELLLRLLPLYELVLELLRCVLLLELLVERVDELLLERVGVL